MTGDRRRRAHARVAAGRSTSSLGGCCRPESRARCDADTRAGGETMTAVTTGRPAGGAVVGQMPRIHRVNRFDMPFPPLPSRRSPARPRIGETMPVRRKGLTLMFNPSPRRTRAQAPLIAALHFRTSANTLQLKQLKYFDENTKFRPSSGLLKYRTPHRRIPRHSTTRSRWMKGCDTPSPSTHCPPPSPHHPILAFQNQARSTTLRKAGDERGEAHSPLVERCCKLTAATAERRRGNPRLRRVGWGGVGVGGFPTHLTRLYYPSQ
ncbi:uncharacterized protein SCHCODRAFT_02123402 [Schizophyllum commune H4-8]|uniref:uncharacterized protein n=1 Tax=Schizophyllum commune (strain H4-8 / FGSC 9210) TaxID=578458 RepID=UPI00215F2CA6|nr:uncharacterized protein SCHCODRAFT_02123402 [Schizophyllum commune H4-8]KAI5885251.1 hypothetical protein SCHCODRAFT_02123402 [Schizophyllum commune H4-8]